MQKDRSFWSEWARFLHHWGLAEFVSALLDAAGPLNLFATQMLYAGRPLLGVWMREERLMALADLFDDQDERRSFATFIREEPTG